MGANNVVGLRAANYPHPNEATSQGALPGLESQDRRFDLA